VDGRVCAFLEDAVDAAGEEAGEQRCAGGVLDAVGGPEGLLDAIEVNDVAGFFAGVSGGEAAVVGGVPVLRSDDDLEFGHECVGDGEDFVAFVDGQCAAGDEIVLQVYENQCTHVSSCGCGL